jgi:hypothetical protein
MSSQTQQIINAFATGKRLKLGCMAQGDFAEVMKELRQYRKELGVSKK